MRLTANIAHVFRQTTARCACLAGHASPHVMPERTRALSEPARSMRLRYDSKRGSPRAAAADPGAVLLSTAMRRMVWLRLLPSL